MAGMRVHLLMFLCLSQLKKYSQERLEGKIVEGEYVKILNYPHAVFLEVTAADKSTHICGSSVLNQYYLVSAAHCFNSAGDTGKILAFAGHENIKKANVVRKGQAVIHEKFDLSKVVNDIALLLLNKQLPLGDRIKRIIIKKNFPQGATGSLAGWGIINEVTEEESIFLKSVTQTLKNKKDCAPLGVGPGTLCAGSKKTSDPRPAAGDSGSGLVTESYQLIGLLSYKINIYPALPVYTNVSYYYYWIKRQTQINFCTEK